MRRVVDTLIVLATLAIGTHFFLVAGWLAPIVVDSGSMGANLPGPHRTVACESCGLRFACDALNLPASGRAVCPNCWCAQNDLTPLPDLPGDRLFVDRAAWTFCGPQRWQTFVLANPEDPKSWVVKRIVGLPGEQLEIREGDVWIDGRRARKDLDTLRAMAILVHDDAHRPSPRKGSASGEPAAPCGWRASGADSAWRQAERGWKWQARNRKHSSLGSPSADAGDSSAAAQADSRGQPDEFDRFDWLTYHHCQSPAAHAGVASPGSIMDDDAYNQSESRVLHPAGDLLVRFKARVSAGVDLAARIGDGRDAFEILWRADTGECELRRRPIAERDAGESAPSADRSSTDDVVQKRPFDATALRTAATIEVAQCDGQILVAIDGRLLIAYEYEPGPATSAPSASPVGIGLAGGASGGGSLGDGSRLAGGALIDELTVLRDVVYLSSAAGVAPSSQVWRLGLAEYFVLGDNSAQSLDSRHWPPGSAARGWLVGRVIGVLAPSPQASPGRPSRE